MTALARAADLRMKRLYDAIEAGVADLDDPALKERVASLKAIRDQARADAQRAQAMLESSGQQAITPKMVRKFVRTARERMRIEGGGYRRDHLRALAQRVEVADKEVRIMGSKGDLLRTLATASGVKSAANGVRSSVLKWRRERDSNPRRAFDPYTLSRGAPSTTRPSLRPGKTLSAQALGSVEPAFPRRRAAMILDLRSVRHLPGNADTAAGVILRGRSLSRRRAIAETRLQLQILADIHVHLDLAGAVRRLRRGHVDPLGQVFAGSDARTSRLGAPACAGAAGRR